MNFFLHPEGHRRKESDPELDPDPDPLFRGTDPRIRIKMSRILNNFFGPNLGEDVVHGLWGAGIVPAEDAEEAEHLDLQEGVRDPRDVVLRRVAGHDQILGIIHRYQHHRNAPAFLAVLRNPNYLLRIWFRWRFWLLTSYVSGSGSLSRPQKAQFSTNFWKNLAFLHSKLFYKEKLISFVKFIVKYE